MDGNVIIHYGIKGQKWGVRRFQNPDGTYTDLGKKRKSSRVFVSGSSKTQDPESKYYRQLPETVKSALKDYVNQKASILIGDAPGIDRQVQDYLKELGYQKVTVFGPGKQVRYQADSNWKSKTYDSNYEPYSPEWLAKKDKAMSRSATEGLAVTLDEGSKATKNNIARLLAKGKPVKEYQLSKKGSKHDRWVR
ncbi:MAG: hypothetical protein J6U54_19845 [Clostridiales bacterium]|nr:hypothetical protein [Clostridiales bacterium]